MVVDDATEAAFWAAIAAAPDDTLPKLVFADWLDERGDPRGQCLRWMVAADKRPAFDQLDTRTWDWWSRSPAEPAHYESSSPREYVLPLNLFSRLPPVGPGLWKGDLARIESVKRLCSAWFACREEAVDPLSDDSPQSESEPTTVGGSLRLDLDAIVQNRAEI